MARGLATRSSPGPGPARVEDPHAGATSVDARDTSPAEAPHGAAPNDVLSITGASRHFTLDDGTGVSALEPVDLQVGPGEIVALVGPSGCGKSTVLNLAGGLLSPTTGEVRILGQPVTGPDRRVSLLFQQPVLLPWRTVESNVLLPAEVHRLPRRTVAPRARQVLERVGLGDFLRARPAQLSGGMQQRVAIARALTYDPELLLMDEPFAALDELTREAMNLELLRIVRDAGTSVLLVTHSISEAVFLADRIVVLTPRPGRVAGVIPVDLGPTRTAAALRDPAFTELTFRVRDLLAA